jgi:hypothetical protein
MASPGGEGVLVSELHSNTTLTIRAEQAVEPVRDLAALLAADSEEAALLSDRLEGKGSLSELDVRLTLSVLSQAVLELAQRQAEVMERLQPQERQH